MAGESTGPQFGFALEYVKDIEEAKRFYVEVVGLEVERYHPTFVQFDSFAIANDESLNGNSDRELYWLIDDAETYFNELSKKAEVTLPLREMPFGKLFAIRGPAGRPMFLIQLAQNRPSQAV
jgi:predicted enzyme related to lactoylglutathione lyase